MLLSIANSRPRNMESIGVAGLYPPSLQESATSIIEFIELYYDYLNTTGLPSNEIANITRDKDIDIVSNKYLTEIQSLIGRNIPNSRVIDKVTLYRVIIQYYRTRGSEDSIHTFFKIFFDEIVDIFYPREYLFDLSGGRGKWSPINIPTRRKTYTNPNKVTLQIKSDYKIGPFPLSDIGPYSVTLKAIKKNIWTYGGGAQSVNLPYVEKTNIADEEEDPIYRWVYRYKDFSIFSTNDTNWPDEAVWEIVSRNIEYSPLPSGFSLLESGSSAMLQNGQSALLENADINAPIETKNIDYSTLTITEDKPVFEDELIVDETKIVDETGTVLIPGNSLIDEKTSPNLFATERIIQSRTELDDLIDIATFGITTEADTQLQVERGAELRVTAIVTEKAGGFTYIVNNTNIEYYHTFEVAAFPEYTFKAGDIVHSLEDVTDLTDNTDFSYSRIYRSSDLDPITWVEIDKNTEVWNYDDNRSFASDLYKLHDGEYWQKYSYRIRSRLPQEDWVNDYLRFIHPAGLKLFSAILYEFISRATWNNLIDYSVKKPQDSYRWLNVYDPPVIGYHTPRHQPGWLSGNNRLLTVILEYLKSSSTEDDYVRLMTYVITIFSQNSNLRDKTVYANYQGWLKYLDPNELICGISDKTIDEASSVWDKTKRNVFSNISSFVNFKIKDQSYYPWFYSELIGLDLVYEDTDLNYFEGLIELVSDELEPNYVGSTLEEKESLIYRHALEKQDGIDDFITENVIDSFVTEGQINPSIVSSLFSNKEVLNENEVVRFYALTKYIPNDTVLYWGVSDSNVSQQYGECVVKNGVAVFKLVPLLNMSTGSPQTFTATIRQGSPTGPILAHSAPVTVNDNTAAPTYSIVSTANSVIEGGAIPFTVSTSNVDDTEALYYSVTLPNDLTPILGGLVIKNGTASFTLIAIPDTLNTEEPESFNVKLYACDSAGLVAATSTDIEILDAYKLWDFSTTSSSTLIGFKVTTAAAIDVSIGWTDGSLEQTVGSDVAITHTYS